MLASPPRATAFALRSLRSCRRSALSRRPSAAQPQHAATHSGRRVSHRTMAYPSKRGAPVLGAASVLLCGMMVSWILAFPASYKLGFWPQLAEMVDDFPPGPAPADTITKYQGQKAVVVLHQLPAAVWAIAMPLQLSQAVRARWLRAHRYTGRVAGVAALSIAAGTVLIIQRGLTVDLPGTHAFLYTITAGFVVSLALGVAAARRKDYARHREWMLRHFALGISVAVQRIFVITGTMLGQAGFFDFSTDESKAAGFAACEILAWLVCMIACEWHIVRTRTPQKAVQSVKLE